MKVSKLGLAAALFATGILGSSIVMAADTASVAVSATVTGTCKFNSGGAVSFTLDPSSGSDATGSVTQPAFWCTKTASYTVDDDMGIHEAVSGSAPRRMQHSSLSEFIPYTFNYTTTGTGAGKTAPITMDIASSISNADFVNASAGSYTDTVTLSITP
ncbi:MAG: spore coat protein U domain-containing protein [Sulfuritalea sp.]|nr:spore coat protein U domain-containing protein [Sulfuritalea sp.]MDP1983084.1 spore coat protein U domain-containing protein [Sulfuritalea sp.]